MHGCRERRGLIDARCRDRGCEASIRGTHPDTHHATDPTGLCTNGIGLGAYPIGLGADPMGIDPIRLGRGFTKQPCSKARLLHFTNARKSFSCNQGTCNVYIHAMSDV